MLCMKLIRTGSPSLTKRGGGFELGIQARLDFSMTPKSIKWFYPVWMALAIALLIVPAPAEATEALIFIHTDVAGSPVAATDIDGNIVWREGYRPYGERTKNESAAAGNRQFFHGKAFDADTGLSYFGARYYDPVVGRFMGVDPQHFDEKNLHSFNRYAYGNNNPYKFKDPDGNSPTIIIPILAWVGGGAAIGGGSAAVFNAGIQYYQTGTVANIWGVGGVVDAAGDGAFVGALLGFAGGAQGGALAGVANAARTGSSPKVIYREGNPSPSNLKVRPGEEAISFRDSLSNPLPKGERPVLRPGENYFGVDTSKLPPGSVTIDKFPPGHVSVRNISPDTLKEAVSERGKFPK